MKASNNQQRVELSKMELNKMKVFCDYLFYDQTKYYASYPRFIECCGFILEQINDIDALTLFKDLCGFNCKYLTAPRLMKRYRECKDKQSKVPLHIKQFLSFLFNSLLKSNNDPGAGRELNEKTYSTDFSTDRRLTNLNLYKDGEDKLKGFTIEYNEHFKYDLYDKHPIEDKFICLNLSLDHLTAIKTFDGITHCFGSYTDKIEYIGFKCRSGMTKSFGVVKGEPFLFGEYGKELNGLKIQINSNGIVFFQPSFNDCGITNQFIDNMNASVEDIQICEERLFSNETPIDDLIIISPIVKDYNESNLRFDFFSLNKGLNTVNGTKEHQERRTIKAEVKEEKEKRKKSAVANKVSNSNGGYVDKWKGQTIKSVSVSSFLLNRDNYNSMIDKLRFEIEREIEEEMLKYDYDKQFDFYDEYLMKYNILTPFPFNPKHYDNYKDIKSIQLDFSAFNNQIIEENNEENESSRNDLFEIRTASSSFTDKQMIADWQRVHKRLKQKSAIALFKSVMCLIKSIKIIQTIEDNFTDESIPLEQKIIFYKELIISKVIIHSLNRGTSFDYAIQNKNEKPQIYSVEEQESSINSSGSDYSMVNHKIIQIENLMKSNANNKAHYNQLSSLYRKYYKIRLDVINAINKEQISNSLKLIEDKYDCKPIKDEIDKEKVSVNHTESILFTSGDIEMSSLKSIDFSSLPIYKKQSISQTKNFKDSLFPSNSISLGDIGLDHWKEVKWEKIDMILYSTNQEILFPNKIDSDIQCGFVMNNYLQVALIAMLKFPFLIKSLFPFYQKSDNGQYGVYLRIKGIWKLVLVDDFFPCLINKQNIACFAFSSLKKSHQIWVQLVEKAFAKINYSYGNMLKNSVKDILDVLTHSLTEKITISLEMKDFVLKILKQEMGKSILVAKATFSHSSCNEVGLIPGNYYIIEGIKDINIGGLPEILIKLSNSFGCAKYKGNWSKNSPKWIPSLVNERPLNDNEFYISLNDYLKYFSVLYINRVYHQTEEEGSIHYSFVYYSKNESISPNVTKLLVSKSTELDIQFHQCNTKHQSNTALSPAFIMITDSSFKYIKSISKTDYSFNLNLELESGEYYLYSDAFSRYLAKSPHGYTLSVYSQNGTELIKTRATEPLDMINRAMISYLKENLNPIKEDFNMNIYQLNKLSPQFPFILHLYSNEGPFEQKIELNVSKVQDKVKNYAFYSCGGDFDDSSRQLNCNLSASKSLLVMLLRLNNENTFNLQYSIEPSASLAEKEDFLIQNGEKEHLDEDEIVIQYIFRCKDGCYVLIKNNSEDEDFKMKLILKGLQCDDYSKGDVVFNLKRKSSEILRLKELEINNSGINSFMFQLA